MSFIIPVKYYNSFWLKKIEADLNIGSPPVRDDKPIWPGLPDDIAPSGYPQFPGQADFNDLNNWFVEETRIKGGFNEDAMSLGNRAYLNTSIDRTYYMCVYVRLKILFLMVYFH